MPATFVIAAMLASGTPAATDNIDVAYDVLAAGQTSAAIEQLETKVQSEDPALLINLAAAYAAEGRMADARALYEKAAYAERYELETSSGAWVDSRVLARKGIARLDAFALDARMASASQ